MPFNKAKALQEAEKYVSQGKIAQAIKQYMHILSRDSSDLALLNTIGDLYVRERNISEALIQFYRLAEAYVEEGFTVKAIAMYKKISKLDPKSVNPLLKLAELYQLQGFGREAREQYFQAVEFYKKKGQNDKALEVLYKVIQLDPENTTYRNRLAMHCEQMGRKDEAAHAYLEGAELAFQREDLAAAEPALKKASELSPGDLRVQLLCARVAMQKKQPEEVQKIITAVPELKAHPAAKPLLLQAYLASHKLKEAEELVLDVYRANPSDFGPIASFVASCVDKDEIEVAYKTLSLVADGLIQQRNTGPLRESLRHIWSKTDRHIPTLELLYRVCESAADEYTLPEVLEALGHAYVQAGELQKAEGAYEKLLHREPENEHYRGLLKQILQKLGKEPLATQAEEFAGSNLALALEDEGEEPPEIPMDPEQEALVKEALENSDIYSRYNLTEKAVAELEKVLQPYPDQIHIHQRILEICRKGFPDRASQAAAALARIFHERGDVHVAEKYTAMVGGKGTAAAEVEAPHPQQAGEAVAPQTGRTSDPTSDTAEFTAGFVFETEQEKKEHKVAPAPAPLEPVEPPPSAAEKPAEIDLSSDLDALMASASESVPMPQAEAPVFNYEESQVEINFYLENGFINEAREAVEELKRKFPDEPLVAELRERVESRAGEAAPRTAPQEAIPEAATVETPPVPAEVPSAAARVDEAGEEDWELPDEFTSEVAAPAPLTEVLAEAVPDEAAPMPEAVEPPAVSQAESVLPTAQAGTAPPMPIAEAASEQPATEGSEQNPLGDLVGELASTIEGFDDPASSVAMAHAAAPEETAAQAMSPLSDLLAEMEEPESEDSAQDDPETHYNLGVAFREMGLLEEAIGEFQKVVKGAGKGKFPPNFLQACSLLAICFMDKKMPAVATKWYARALEAPNLDEEAALALQYDLGLAYEKAGDTRTALEKYTEVYSQNIDFRDIAEKIRTLQHKVS